MEYHKLVDKPTGKDHNEFNADRKILIISYLFPPVGGIGVQRALSLAKYLPRSGFEVHVLKATSAGGPVYDPDLLKQIPSGVRVHQAFTPEIPFTLRQKLWSRLKGNGQTHSNGKQTTAGLFAKGMDRCGGEENHVA